MKLIASTHLVSTGWSLNQVPILLVPVWCSSVWAGAATVFWVWHLEHNLSPSESLQFLVHTGLGISSILFLSLADLIDFLSLFPPCSPSFCPFALHVSLADSYHASLVWSFLSARAIHSGFAHHITQASFEVHAEQWVWNLDPHEVTRASTMCLILQFRSMKFSSTFLISWIFALRVRDRS